ncbi:MAG: CCA tRNA nucleotidyltransferase [Deltaproteobacteria bacterium]|nr:CCA tRNA nucleotidyltransferase [Deltaproteobacteria bacterium]
MTAAIPDSLTGMGQGALRIVRTLRNAGHEAFFVGGCVRDLFRGEAPEDYDIVTSARPDAVQALFPRTYPVGVSFGVILVNEGDHAHEVATYRKEAEYEDGRHPSQVSFATAKEDVYRRDFTINGLLMDPETGEIVDYVGGVADIERRVIRTIGNPEERFAEDHLRMLRAVRFAANLGFLIDTETLGAIKRHSADIARVSAERVREEMTRILTGPGPRQGLEWLQATGLLSQLLPEIEAMRGVSQPPQFHPEGDVWEHTLSILALLPQERRPDTEANGRLAWAALLHDVGKPATRTESETGVHFYGHVKKGAEIAAAIMRRLKFSKADQDVVLALLENHMRFMHVQDMRPNTVKKFLRMPDFDLHLALHRLDCLGSHGHLDNDVFCRGKLKELTTEDLHPPRLLTGHDLQALGFQPGPLFREILSTIEDAQLNGEIATAKEARQLVISRFLSGSAADGHE